MVTASQAASILAAQQESQAAAQGLAEAEAAEELSGQMQVDGVWPLVRLIGDSVAVVCVNSARPNPQPWRSSGRIPDTQIKALRDVLRDPRLDTVADARFE